MAGSANTAQLCCIFFRSSHQTPFGLPPCGAKIFIQKTSTCWTLPSTSHLAHPHHMASPCPQLKHLNHSQLSRPRQAHSRARWHAAWHGPSAHPPSGPLRRGRCGCLRTFAKRQVGPTNKTINSGSLCLLKKNASCPAVFLWAINERGANEIRCAFETKAFEFWMSIYPEKNGLLVQTKKKTSKN